MDSGGLILLEWDIANAIIFYAVRKEKDTKYKIEEEARQATKGVKFSDDHKALVLWSLQNRNEDRSSKVADTSRSLIVYRVSETTSDQVVQLTKEVVDFNLQVAKKEKERFDALQVRFDKVLDAYNARGWETEEKNKIIAKLEWQAGKKFQSGESLQAMLATSPAPPPPKGTIIMLPETP